MTSLITDEIKYQLFDAIVTKLKDELKTDDEYNDIMENMILDNPTIFISYGFLYYIVNYIEIDTNQKVDLLDYAWKHWCENTLITEFQNYFLYLSVSHLK